MMETPSKCPKCGAALVEVTKYGIAIYECCSARSNDTTIFAQSGLCERERELPSLKARNAILDAALAEAVAVACRWRDHHSEKGSIERAAYWNDLACRWQDARAEANAGPAEKGGDK